MNSPFQPNFISTTEFAGLVGISTRKARSALEKCHDGKIWRGAKLYVIHEKGKGGKNGLQYLVDKSSIPPSLIKNQSTIGELHTLDTSSLEEAEALPIIGDSNELIDQNPRQQLHPKKTRHHQESTVNFKLDLVKRIIAGSEPNTPERTALINRLAITERYPYGKKKGKPVGASTLRTWIKAYGNEGIGAVCRKARIDSGKRRVMVSRAWDDAVRQLGLDENEQQRLVIDLQRHVASLWRSGTPSTPTLQLNALPFAINQLAQAGCPMGKEALKAICKLPLSFIKQQSHFKLVNIYEKDAGRYAAKHKPRIKRTRANLKPMDWVAGDVHHIDIAFQREDGSLCTIKAVAWLDLATNRAFVSPFLMDKGEMIRREHVIESFVAMCTDPNWGVPTRLYLDRGGEYNWGEIVEDLCRLKSIVISDFDELDENEGAVGVNRSLPYNPQSKVIETLFANLEKTALSQIPGHIGGDRMRKKVENQGKAPIPYPGDFAEYQRSLQTAVNYYHAKPQQGHLSGQSPNQRFAQYLQGPTPWKSVLIDPDELAIAFCKKNQFRTVYAGGVFQWNNKEYRHDKLIPLAGLRKVQVGQPLFGDKSRLFLFDEEDNLLGEAEPVVAYDFGDVAGAGEQQRQAKVARQVIQGMKAATDKIPLQDVLRETAAVMGESPQAEVKNIVSIGEGHRQIAKATRENPPDSTANNEISERRRQQSAALAELAQKARAAGGA